MPDKNTLSRAGFAHFDMRYMQDSFTIDSKMREEKQKITRYECYMKNCHNRIEYNTIFRIEYLE